MPPFQPTSSPFGCGILLIQQKLIFLHWYHHITVLLFCWHASAYTSTTGLHFVAMNYTVHFVMYGYYFLVAIKMWPKGVSASFITVAQISQMILGITLCIMSFRYLNDDQPCAVRPENVISGALLYGSYLYLFVDFFARRFLFRTKAQKKAITRKTL